MRNKRSVVISLLILIAVAFNVTACDRGVRVGDLETKSQTVELDDADSVTVTIQMGAGDLNVSGGANELLEASFTYNVEELNPRATYNNGRLEVKDSDVREGIRSLFDLNEFRNEWDLKFNEGMPMYMTIDLGLGHSNLELGSLALTRLNLNGGAGDVDVNLSGSQYLRQLDFSLGAGEVAIDLTGDWQNDLDAQFDGGLGDFSLKLPADVGVRIKVEPGIGGVDATGLTKDGNTYTNDVYGESDVTLIIDISGGVGQINLDVE